MLQFFRPLVPPAAFLFLAIGETVGRVGSRALGTLAVACGRLGSAGAAVDVTGRRCHHARPPLAQVTIVNSTLYCMLTTTPTQGKQSRHLFHRVQSLVLRILVSQSSFSR